MSQSTRDIYSSSSRVLRSNSTYRYETLMSVQFAHAYYNASNNVCPGLAFYPTVASQQLMTSLGMIYKDFAGGFAVLYDANRPQLLLQYLKSQNEDLLRDQSQSDPFDPVPSSSDGPWTGLSFMVSVTNPMFVNVTDMPIETRPERRAYYFSNTTLGTSAGSSMPTGTLSSGPLTSEGAIAATGSQYALQIVNELVIQVVLYDAGGQPALKYGPLYPPKPAPHIPVSLYPTAYIDLSGIPEGKYTAKQFVDLEPVDPVASRDLLYMYSAPTPMFFIDLVFADPYVNFESANPLTGSPGVYPVGEDFLRLGSADAPSPEPGLTDAYTVSFKSRSTFWNYYVVSTGHPLSDLAIICPDPATPQVSFSPAEKVTLSNNQSAWLIASEQSIALQERSPYNFQLTGKVGGLRAKQGVLVNRLPVSSGSQIIPLHSHFATGLSSPPAPKGTGAGKKKTPKQTTKTYSDIYVYL